MKRKSLVRIHIAATFVAALTILTFFTFSLIAEINGDITFIKQVKSFIVCALPIMIIVMPALNISGDKLAGKSQNITVLIKRRRMKWVMINGIGLIFLAVFLYYRSHYRAIDEVFLLAQIAEFICGLTNLVLIALNAKSGFQISGRLRNLKYEENKFG